MTTYRRRKDQEPQVREFHNYSTHRENMVVGHMLAAWAYEMGEPSNPNRVKSVSVRPADNGIEKGGVHAIGRNDVRGSVLFVVHPGEYLVWENDEFRVYTPEEFAKVFESQLEAATPNRYSSGVAQQRDGA